MVLPGSGWREGFRKLWVSYYKMQWIIKIIQKLRHHASNLCFVGERNSKHGFFKLRWNVPLQISAKSSQNMFLCRDCKEEKCDRFGSKPIMWSYALRSLLLPHSSEHRSRKPLERSILGIWWKSQGCIYLCSANAMTWARKVNQRFTVKFPETI